MEKVMESVMESHGISESQKSTNPGLTTRKIVGPNMLRPFAWNHNNVGTCLHLLRIVRNRSNF